VCDYRPLGESSSELGEHAIAGRELDEGLRAFRQALMIAAEPTPPRDPGKAALDDPSSGQRAESWWKELIPLDLGADRGTSSPRLGTVSALTDLAWSSPHCCFRQSMKLPP